MATGRRRQAGVRMSTGDIRRWMLSRCSTTCRQSRPADQTHEELGEVIGGAAHRRGIMRTFVKFVRNFFCGITSLLMICCSSSSCRRQPYTRLDSQPSFQLPLTMTKMFVVVVTLLLQLATAEYGVWSTFRYHSPGHYVIPLQASGSGYRKAAFAVKADDEFQVDVYPFKSAVPGLTRCFPDRWFMSMFSCEFPHRLPKRCFPLLNDVTPLAYGPSSNKTFWLAPIDLFTGKSAANPGEHTGGLLVIIRFNRPRRFIENTRRALSRGLVTRKAWSRLCTIRFIASTDLRPSEGSS